MLSLLSADADLSHEHELNGIVKISISICRLEVDISHIMESVFGSRDSGSDSDSNSNSSVIGDGPG